jgi:molecular chaperone DnaK
MNSAAINEIILVGGSTYIPIVRNALKERLQVNVNCSIDPTTAVVVGAAYYAGSKTKQVKPALAPKSPETKGNRNTPPTPSVNVKTAYQKNSREQEEYFTALVLQAPPDSLYRITREDGGYDSGIKNVTERISEMLNLLPDTTNFFKLKFFDATQNILPSNEEDIVIVQGKFSIDGQPLPHDICIEVDDDDTKTTFLEVVFERNTLLPIKKSITKTLSRSILKGSSDQLLINVLEGSRFGSPQANLPIGLISIKGTELTRDLIKGCDIDLTFEISESRDITIKAYISLTDQEYAQVFNPSVRAVNTSRLKEEIDYLIRQGQRNQEELTRNERYEESAVLQQSISELNQLLKKIEQLNADDVTDARYQADELKRKYASIIENAGKGPLVIKLKEDYFGSKSLCEYYMQQSANPQLKKRFEEIVNSEPEWLHTDNAAYIKRKTRELWTLTWDIRKKDLAYLTQTYLYYALKPDNEYTDQKQIKLLKKRGDEALERKNPEELLSLLVQMHDFLINKNDDEMLKGTGLSG